VAFVGLLTAYGLIWLKLAVESDESAGCVQFFKSGAGSLFCLRVALTGEKGSLSNKSLNAGSQDTLVVLNYYFRPHRIASKFLLLVDQITGTTATRYDFLRPVFLIPSG
jgi:hypothetical protein